MEVKVDDMDKMSMEELEKLEDDIVADDSSNEQTSGDDDPTATSDNAGSLTDDLVKHVSPPSKWAAERARRNALKAELEETKAKAEKAEQMEQELSELKEKLGWIEQTVKAKGIELPSGPADAFSEDRITEIREEYGDELADMMQAAASMLIQQGKGKTAEQENQPTQADGHGADEDLMAAIDDNNELSYWRANSEALWNKAVETDTQLLKDPDYQKMSFKARFEKVVELVKNDVIAKSKNGSAAESMDRMPSSLSESSGTTPPPVGDSPLDKILAAADDPDKQLSLYNGLSEAERDEVDKSLNI